MSKRIHKMSSKEIEDRFNPDPVETRITGLEPDNFSPGGWGDEHRTRLLIGLHHRLARIEEKLNDIFGCK